MTVDYKENPDDKLIELTVDGKVTQDDFDRIAGQLEAFIEAHGKIKLLEEIHEFKGFEPSMLWDGVKFDLRHLKHFTHCAVVSDMGWLGPFSKLAGAFIQCEVRVFPSDQISDAKVWLQEAE